MEDIKLTVLQGTLDSGNYLSALRGNALVWNKIFDEVSSCHYRKHIDVTSVSHLRDGSLMKSPFLRDKPLKFPKPRDLDINMMPVKLFDDSTWPVNCKPYMRVLRSHCPMAYAYLTTYLTVQECLVPVGSCQRREGLHIERPGRCGEARVVQKPSLDDHEKYYNSEYHGICWGLGYCDYGLDLPVDGIYFASNIADSSRVFDALIVSPENVTDKHGGIEPMRPYLGEGHKLKANELCWITDRTPHETLPVQAPEDDPTATHVYRQFVRLVAGKISVWHSKHNTPNPTGLQPDAPISDEDKFSEPSKSF